MINRKFVDYTLTFTLALLVSACHSVADTPSTSTHDKFFTYAPQTIEPIVSYQDPERITPEMCPYHIDGTPLGLSCLHCEHPLAQMQAQQISEIAATFTFDSYRLDFAKAAYANCYDKANYFLLKNTFTFTSYYNDLIESVN